MRVLFFSNHFFEFDSDLKVKNLIRKTNQSIYTIMTYVKLKKQKGGKNERKEILQRK